MKVTLEAKYKDLYTLTLLEVAKKIIAIEKDDCETAKGWAEFAIREALKDKDGNYTDYLAEVLKAEAHTARNYRAWNAFFEGSQDMDVWIDAVAETSCGFIKVGAYLSDIWQTGAEHYKHHMYIEYYTKSKTNLKAV